MVSFRKGSSSFYPSSIICRLDPVIRAVALQRFRNDLMPVHLMPQQNRFACRADTASRPRCWEDGINRSLEHAGGVTEAHHRIAKNGGQDGLED